MEWRINSVNLSEYEKTTITTKIQLIKPKPYDLTDRKASIIVKKNRGR